MYLVPINPNPAMFWVPISSNNHCSFGYSYSDVYHPLSIIEFNTYIMETLSKAGEIIIIDILSFLPEHTLLIIRLEINVDVHSSQVEIHNPARHLLSINTNVAYITYLL